MKKYISFILTFLIFSIKSYSQSYCIGFSIASNNGTQLVLDISLNITGSAFNVGSSNLVFTYNSNALSSPTLVSHSITAAYQTPTVTTPVVGQAYFNLELNSAGTGISASSVTARLSFDITNTAALTGFSTHTSSVVFKDDETNIVPMTGGCPTLNVSLPVELLNFRAYSQGKTNFLDWQTANEKDNAGFSIERSAEGKVFQAIGFIKGYGTTTEKQSYTFTDETPLSMSYYRLRQIDNDGKETLSKVISVERESNNKLKIYPNPVTDVLTIEGERNTVSLHTDHYQILNFLGQEVMTGKTTQQIDVLSLPQGTYFLKVGTEQAKFVKQ